MRPPRYALRSGPPARSAQGTIASIARRAGHGLAAVLVVAGLLVAAPQRLSAQSVLGCPTPDPGLIIPDARNSSAPSCNYAVNQRDGTAQTTIGGFAVVVEYGCAAEIAKSWTGKPRTNRRVTSTEVFRAEQATKSPFKTFTGQWTTQEKVFLLVGSTAIATVTAYSDGGIYDSKGLRAVATAVSTSNQARAGSSCGADPNTAVPNTAGTKLMVTGAFTEPSLLNQALRRQPVRVEVTAQQQAVQGATIEVLRFSEVVGRGTTGADGAATIDFALGSEVGKLRIALDVRATKEGHVAGRNIVSGVFDFTLLDTVTVVDPAPGGPFRRNESLTFTGRVLASVRGVPLPKGVVSEIEVQGQNVRTDADGVFSVSVAAALGMQFTASPVSGLYRGSSAFVTLDLLEAKRLVVTAWAERSSYGPDDTVVVKGTATADGGPAGAVISPFYNDVVGGQTVARGIAPFAADAVGNFSFRIPSLSTLQKAVINGSLFVIVKASGVGVEDGVAQFIVRVRNRFDACEPGEATVVAGEPQLQPAEVSNEKWGHAATAGRRFADGTDVVAGNGRVLLGFPLDKNGSAVAGVTVLSGSTVRVLRYCRGPDGRTMLVLEVKDRNAIRVGVDNANGTGNWQVQIVTRPVTVTNIRTDYVVAVRGDTTAIALHEGAVNLVPSAGQQPARIEARQLVTVRAGDRAVHSEPLPADVTAAIEDPVPPVRAAALGGFVSPSAAPVVDVFTIEAGLWRVRAGEVVTVPVFLHKAERVANINFELSYDAAVVGVDGDRPVRLGSFMDGSLLQFNTKKSGVVKVGIARRTGRTGDGQISLLRFVARGKPGDSSPLVLAVTTVNAEDGMKLDAQRLHGRIEIINSDEALPGDCDGNSRLDEGDALCALQMSVLLRPPSAALDVDGAAGVTSRDAAVILRGAIGRKE